MRQISQGDDAFFTEDGAGLMLCIALGACGREMFASKWDSWVGSDWQEFAQAARHQECGPVSSTHVKCSSIDWKIDSRGIIIGSDLKGV